MSDYLLDSHARVESQSRDGTIRMASTFELAASFAGRATKGYNELLTIL
jgi:hypothetical protein